MALTKLGTQAPHALYGESQEPKEGIHRNQQVSRESPEVGSIKCQGEGQGLILPLKNG